MLRDAYAVLLCQRPSAEAVGCSRSRWTGRGGAGRAADHVCAKLFAAAPDFARADGGEAVSDIQFKDQTGSAKIDLHFQNETEKQLPRAKDEFGGLFGSSQASAGRACQVSTNRDAAPEAYRGKADHR